ncbi:hypothetical protein ALC57_09523 [Trachymyrmex cornetzi]|uniref:Uncharacterized protein n=1 Tax=Trachymyrmex cornetzi TaxID=471704 RepID=A0A195DZ80_9HYME|nr:hypothetical protein ALC57_09523 [Trachymyrmex cornetzi]
MAQKVKPVRGADADSVARTVHSPVNGDLNTRDEEHISAKKDGKLSSSSSLYIGADLSSLTRRKKERRRTERSIAISTLTGGKQRRVLAQVKVRSRGSAEKARKTRSEKRSSSESGIHRDSAPSFTSPRRFFAKSDLCSDVSCSSLRPSRCPLFVVEGERKRSLKMRPGLRRATATAISLRRNGLSRQGEKEREREERAFFFSVSGRSVARTSVDQLSQKNRKRLVLEGEEHDDPDRQ